MPPAGEPPRSDAPLGSTRELSTRVMDTPTPIHARRGRRPLPPVPARIGRFRPLEVLGQGGMGVVYRAEDPSLGRTIALKLLTPHRGDVDAQQRLRREAQALARLSHPHVVQVFHCGVYRGQVYIAMELVAGRSLRAWASHAPRSIEAIVDAYVQAADGLAAAHARGIVHRDFKPDNAIMGDDGRVRVVDFGLACADAGTGGADRPAQEADPEITTAPWPSMLELPLTASGTVMGTPVYMAPELHQGSPASPSSDQFALCVSLFEATYGQRPFSGARVLDLVAHMLRGEVRGEPDDARVPAWLRGVLLRGLQPDPAARWPSMEALGTELRRGLALRPRRRTTLALALSLALGGTAVAIAATPASPPCRDLPDALAGTWDDARRAQVREGLLRDQAPFEAATWTRVEAQLDDYAARWQDAYLRSCSRQRHADAEDPSMTCVERRRQGLAALVELLARADEDVLVRATSLVGELGDVDECLLDPESGSSALPVPRDPAQAREVEALHEQLARIAAERSAGHYDTAAREAEAALRAAEALGYAPLLAEAAYADGMARYQAGDPVGAEQSLERAYFSAAALGYDELVGEASAGLVYAAGVGRGDVEAATRWAEHALAATAGRDEQAEAHALSGLGMVHFEQGDLPQAQALFERALALRERSLDPLDPRIAAVEHQLGMVLANQGRYDEAIAHHEHALEIWEQAVGPDHPKLAGAYNYRGMAYERSGQHERALGDYQRALAIWEQALGPDHVEVGVALANLGALLRTMDRPQESLAYSRRALACWEAAFGPEHPRVASLYLNIGYALEDLGDRAGALDSYRRSLALREQLLGPSHPQTEVAREAVEELAAF